MQQNIVVRGIINKGSTLLLLKRLSNKEVHPGLFELPGGKVEFGESTEEALSRELAEETGSKFTTFTLNKVYSYMQGERHAVGICYNVTLNDNNFEPVLSSDEHDEYVWADIGDIEVLPISDETKLAIQGSALSSVAKNTNNITEVKLYTDGGSRGNPGPSALGYVVMDSNDNVVTKSYKYLGITTNNQAEYQAVKAGLQYCADLKYHKVSVYLDSQLVANQMNGIYKIKNRDLWPIHESIKQLIKVFKDGVQFTYIPREYNTDADEMVNTALDEFESNKH